MKPTRKQQIITYIDLAITALLCVIFSAITFSIPLEQYVSSTQAAYGRLFAAILLGIGASLAIFITIDTLLVWPRQTALTLTPKPSPPRLKKLSESYPLTFLSNHPRLRKIAEHISLNFAHDLMKANQTQSPYRLAAKSLFYTLLTLTLIVPISFILTFLVNPFCIILLTLPLIPFSYFRLKLKSAAGDRKRAIDDEIPFFAIYAGILQSVGVNLYNALLQAIGKNVFRQIEKDALIVKRNVEFFFQSPLDALEETGRSHPNEKMKNLLLGYTSEWRSGGDLSRYLEAKAGDYLKDVNFKWKTYANRASDLGETVISLLFLLPMVILMSAFIFPSQATTLIGAAASIALPLLTVTIFSLINASQPKTYDTLTGNLKLSIFTGASTFTLTLLLGTAPWLSIAATLAAASTAYGAAIFLQLRENSQLEKALPQLLRDLTEYKKMGYDLTKAILKLSQENPYTTPLNNLLQTIARQIKLGVRMAEIELPTRSWLTKISFFLLTEIAESGGGTASSLEKLTDYVNQTVRTKQETYANMRLYQALSLFTPIGLSLITALMFTLLTVFSTTLLPDIPLSLFTIGQIPQNLTDLSYLLILASSACIALLTAKTTNLTAKNTLWITINMTLAAGSIVLSLQLATLLTNLFSNLT